MDFNKYNRIDYSKAKKIIEIKDLHVSFKTDAGIVKAIRGVSLDLYKGETLCVVGESGCGKSTVCKALMGILSNEAIVDSGEAYYEGEDLTKISEDEFHRIRGNKIGMIFQDPLSSLNPIMKVGKQIIETTMINKNVLKKKYSDLISKELIDYKNAETKYHYGKIKLQKEADYFLKERNESLDNDIYSMQKENKSKEEISTFKKEQKSIISKEYKEIKLKNKEEINKLSLEYKTSRPELVKNLKVAKKLAKRQINIYKTFVEDKYKTDKELLIDKYSSDQVKLKEELTKLKEEKNKQFKFSKKDAKKMALEVMREVGINNPEQRFNQYPFEFSGGMRQRIVIAIALTANPDVLICDEPTTALDVTIQAQILELINRLKKERNMSIIFITHDLGVVANMADRIAVMYAGKVVEIGTAMEVFYQPKHPYTWALLSSIPDVNSKEKLEAIPGTPPNLVSPPKGDAFADRNRYALKIDYEYEPPFFKLSDTHFAATWLLHEDAPKVEPPKIVTERIEESLKEEEEYERQ